MNITKIILRIHEWNPNHHLYLNNGTYWVHYTRHLADFTKQRVRQSLGTNRLAIARHRRYELFARLQAVEAGSGGVAGALAAG